MIVIQFVFITLKETQNEKCTGTLVVAPEGRQFGSPLRCLCEGRDQGDQVPRQGLQDGPQGEVRYYACPFWGIGMMPQHNWQEKRFGGVMQRTIDTGGRV